MQKIVARSYPLHTQISTY